jgi:endonuclease/exonuclease/phosphatase family metal-dependent hydrolase
VSSGLVIATEFPLIAWGAQPFGRSSCAGFDCLSNKGLALARVAIPGLPAPLDLYTTHMNAMRASRVKEARHFAAHARQAREIGEYLEAQTPSWLPVIFGGDFNMRAAPARFETFEAVHGLELVHVRCLADSDLCDVRMSWDGDAPWLDTQDLQLFGSGTIISVRPVRVEAMFDGSPGSPRLSDHDGLRVVYELSWPAAASPPEPCSASQSGRNSFTS